MAKTVFIRGAEQQPLADALFDLAARDDHAADRGGILDRPPAIWISPAIDGWTAVNGLAGWIDDLAWAACELSVQGETAVSCELIGNSLRLRLGQFASGERRHLVKSPAEVAWGDLAELRGPMPLYEDVEVKAFKTLRVLGIPGALLGIGLEPFGGPASCVLGEGLELAPTISSVEDSDAPAQKSVEIHGAPLETDTQPLLPRQVGRDFGVSFFEERYVEGKPGSAAVDRLLELEQAWRSRAQKLCPDAPVELTMTYHGGTYQHLLDDALRKRGRHVTPSPRSNTPPWWAFWHYFGKWNGR